MRMTDLLSDGEDNDDDALRPPRGTIRGADP
jgi:hypothetical protein